jgi:beta-lactamase class A
MRGLYNASYLNNKNSEFATELLIKCNFKNGIVSGMPSSTKIAHKFGESGDAREQQLNESAIIYLNNNPYIITIMTKGKDYKQLPTIIKEISNATYQFMEQNAVSVN